MIRAVQEAVMLLQLLTMATFRKAVRCALRFLYVYLFFIICLLFLLRFIHSQYRFRFFFIYIFFQTFHTSLSSCHLLFSFVFNEAFSLYIPNRLSPQSSPICVQFISTLPAHTHNMISIKSGFSSVFLNTSVCIEIDRHQEKDGEKVI